MADRLPIVPFAHPVSGGVRPPGSKSLTNRALLLAALCPHPVRLEGLLDSRDSRIFLTALDQLGIAVEGGLAEGCLTVHGTGGRIPNAQAGLHFGNAGTAARFLTAFLCLREGGCYRLDGDAAMRERPMAGLLAALASLGAHFDFLEKEGHFPLTLRTGGLPGGEVILAAGESSQFLSALLMAAPLARGPLAIRLDGPVVSEPFVGMTLGLMARFGVRPAAGRLSERRFDFVPGCYAPAETSIAIEPDATAASYFMALPAATGGQIAIEGLAGDSLQGDLAFTRTIQRMGARVSRSQNSLNVCWPGPLAGVEENFQDISDTFLTAAALAPLLEGPLYLTGIGHTRRQETDRIRAMATEMMRLGQGVEEEPEALHLRPDLAELAARAQAARACGKLLTVETYEDHRMAMSLAVLGCHNLLGDGRPWLQIDNPACCGKTYPRFFETLENLRRSSLPPSA